MPKLLNRPARVLGGLLLLLALAAVLRLGLLPRPWGWRQNDWRPTSSRLAAGQVTRTEYYRGFFQSSRTFDAVRSRAILAVLQDSSHFQGDTTPDFTQMLAYYDANGQLLGCTHLDLFSDHLAVAATEPGGFGRGSVLTREGRTLLLRTLDSPMPRAR